MNLKEQYKRIGGKLNEAEIDTDVSLPQKVKVLMAKLVAALKSADLKKKKKISIFLRIIQSLGISPQELNQFSAKVKKEI